MNIQVSTLDSCFQQLSLTSAATGGCIDGLIGARSASILTSFTECKDALVFGAAMCKIMSESLTVFQSGTLIEFDALVSDTACHVRAAVIASLYKRLSSDIGFQEAVSRCISTCVRVRKLFQDRACQASSNRLSVKEALFSKSIGQLFQESFEGTVVPEFVLIAQCYLLTKIRRVLEQKVLCACCQQEVPGYKDITDTSKVTGYFKNVPKAWVGEFVTCAKQNVASQSLQMLRRLSCSTVEQFNSFDRSIKPIEGRLVAACSVSIDAVIRSVCSQQMAVVLKVKKEAHLVEKSPEDSSDVSVLYRPDLSGRLVPSQSSIVGEPVIVVGAVRSGLQVMQETVDQYTSRLLQFDFIKLLQLNAAQHPQYPNKGSVEECAEREVLAERARSIGCSLGNQSLFCITHIYAATIGGRQ